VAVVVLAHHVELRKRHLPVGQAFRGSVGIQGPLTILGAEDIQGSSNVHRAKPVRCSAYALFRA